MIDRRSTRIGALRASAIAVLAVLLLPGLGSAEVTLKKSIWGPTQVGGRSQFPIYRDLGAGIYQMALRWSEVASTRPARASDPSDPAYMWPSEIDYAIAEATRNGIQVSLLITGAPGWANGGRPAIWAPDDPRDFAAFAAAASRRYPQVDHWMIWGEPSKASRFQPLVSAMGRRMNNRQRRGPRIYARMLDASYGALKRVSRRDLVIGGNTWTGGEVLPRNFIRAMRLPDGSRPRMDLYGHNPFTNRSPAMHKSPIDPGYADFSDLDTLSRWLDRAGYRDTRRRPLRLFLSELVIPTDHANRELNFWVPKLTQARWLARALRISRRWHRIYTLGYLGLYDDPPRADGLEVNRGLIDHEGRKKPAYRAFKRG